ncbi:GAD-like domain-containing protein, partial [Reichenbachiella sp.]
MMKDFYIEYNNIVKGEELSIENRKKYDSIFPKELIDIWDEHGLASFNKGIFSLVNPEESIDIIEDLKVKDALFKIKSREFYVFGKTAFGSVFILSIEPEKTSVIVYDILYSDYSVIISDSDFDFMFNVLFLDESVKREELSEELFRE